jgi:hypothetical protein
LLSRAAPASGARRLDDNNKPDARFVPLSAHEIVIPAAARPPAFLPPRLERVTSLFILDCS